MREEICPNNLCTACGACENICPKACVERELGASSFTMRRGESCVHCDLCVTVCPTQNELILNQPTKAYAAWSNDDRVRKSSASGGIATSIYRYAADNAFDFVGAAFDENFECRLQLCSKHEDVFKFQNSKYAYSYADAIYKQVDQKLSSGENVVFIGLPCQVAALRRYLKTKKHSDDKLWCVDLICHGTPNPDFLKQHIRSVSNQFGKKASSCYFRDPNYETSNYYFSLYSSDSEKPYYSKAVEADDLYQIGFHESLIYREACYNCMFAQAKRAGDLTIGDFHVWDVDSCDIDITNVSTILVNTTKGQDFLRLLFKDKYIEGIERSVEEIVRGEPQLRHPSVAGPERVYFLDEYTKLKDYDAAARVAFSRIVRSRKLKIGRIKFYMKKMLKVFIPRSIWLSLKRKYKKG